MGEIVNESQDETLSIGVVIVNYNGGQYLSRCLASVFRSDCPLRVVVVDNDSKDGSFQALSRIDPGRHELITVSNSGNFGFSRGVNIGIDHLDTDLVMLLNPDCEVHPHTIGRLAATFRAHPDAGVVGALVFNENGTEQRGCRRREPTLWRSLVTSLGLGQRLSGVDMTAEPLPAVATRVDAVSGSAMMLHRGRLMKIDGMDESFFLHCEDLDVCHRMRNAGYSVYFEPRVSLFHRQGVSSGGGWKKIERMKHDGMLRYYRRHYHGGLGVPLKLMEGAIWLRLQAVLALGRLKARRNPDVIWELPPSADWRSPCLLLTGAATDVGAAVMRRLQKTGITSIATTRGKNSSAGKGCVRILSMEYFEKAPLDDLPYFDRWLHLAPVWTWQSFESVLNRSRPVRIVALSSTSVVAKADSSDPKDRAVVEALYDGEKGIARYASECRASLTILRPTMIYGGSRNRNINLVRRVTRWLRVFPMVGSGEGMRQPVHSSEVANACLAALDRTDVDGTYTIAGSEVLSYRDMVRRVFEAQGLKPRIVNVPEKLARGVVRVAGRLPGLDMLSEQMLERLNRDQAFSNERASHDLGYQPGPFNP